MFLIIKSPQYTIAHNSEEPQVIFIEKDTDNTLKCVRKIFGEFKGRATLSKTSQDRGLLSLNDSVLCLQGWSSHTNTHCPPHMPLVLLGLAKVNTESSALVLSQLMSKHKEMWQSREERGNINEVKPGHFTTSPS